jgi:cob(I)alamin adenosyltransferase
MRFVKMIHVYTGEGEGKTISALGLALRAVGHGKRVVMIQFMKGRKDTGEYATAKRLVPEFELYQFGREELIDLRNPERLDFKLAWEGFSFAKEIVKGKPDLLVLDEINLAIAIGLLKLEDVLEFIQKIPDSTTVILTGRNASKELIEMADLATEMRYLKHPYEKGVESREGLDY